MTLACSRDGGLFVEDKSPSMFAACEHNFAAALMTTAERGPSRVICRVNFRRCARVRMKWARLKGKLRSSHLVTNERFPNVAVGSGLALPGPCWPRLECARDNTFSLESVLIFGNALVVRPSPSRRRIARACLEWIFLGTDRSAQIWRIPLQRTGVRNEVAAPPSLRDTVAQQVLRAT